MYHGIIIDQEFKDKGFSESFNRFAKKIDGSWVIYGISIENDDLEKEINRIQNNLKDDEPWYSHIYNDERLIVIFKNKIFYVLPNKSSWRPIIKYGKKLKIPERQLDFWPNRFQDEIHYFSKEEFND